MCVEQGQTLARRPGRRAVALRSTKGPLSTCCATGAALGAPATFSAAGELWGFNGCAPFLGLAVTCDGRRTLMGEAHAGIPFFNRTICLWNSGVRRTCEPCVRERLGAACNDDYTASHERVQSHVMRGVAKSKRPSYRLRVAGCAPMVAGCIFIWMQALPAR